MNVTTVTNERGGRNVASVKLQQLEGLLIAVLFGRREFSGKTSRHHCANDMIVVVLAE